MACMDCFITQDPLPMGGTMHNKLGPPASVIDQANDSAVFLMGPSGGAFSFLN